MAAGSNINFNDILDRIKPVQSLPLVVTAVTYGHSGTGKTTFASTWPKPILLIDAQDKGTDSIKDIEDVDVFSAKTLSDVEKAYWYLKSGKSGYKTVIIDTFTQVQELAVQQVLDDEDREFMSQQAWGQVSGILKGLAIDFRDLEDDGINVNFIFQDRIQETETGSNEDGQIDPVVGPQVIPSVAGMINAAVKVIAHTFISEETERTPRGTEKVPRYCLRVGPHPFYTTKIRKPKGSDCPAYLVNPHFDDVIRIMKGEYQEPQAEPVKTPRKRNTSTTNRRKRTTKK